MSDTRKLLILGCFCLILCAGVSLAGGDHCSDDDSSDDVFVPPTTVCDPLKYGTPGLFGLCAAICVLEDCNPDFNQPDPFADCRPVSKRLYKIYEAIRQPGDMDLPCVTPGSTCSCYAPDEFGATTIFTCSTGPIRTTILGSPISAEVNGNMCLFANESTGELRSFDNLSDAETAACTQILLDAADAVGEVCVPN